MPLLRRIFESAKEEGVGRLGLPLFSLISSQIYVTIREIRDFALDKKPLGCYTLGSYAH